MIPVVDTSDWGSPYDQGVFDWDRISGGSLSGNLLGIGDDAPSPSGTTLPETEVVGQCDFAQGDVVKQIQQQLNVPVTGYFDDATCAAWYEQFGEAPTAETLEGATNAACATVVVPRCAEAAAGQSLPLYLIVGGAAAALAGALILWRAAR